jgi:poly [ADP-ribose] polymerase
MNQTVPAASLDAGVANFKNTFKSKTGNIWSSSIETSFKAQSNKYTISDLQKPDPALKPSPSEVVSAIPIAVKQFIEMIIDVNMIVDQAAAVGFDHQKFPLSYLSETHLSNARRPLVTLQRILNEEEPGDVAKTTCEFYTYIPHNVGRALPPKLNTGEKVQQKFDMVNLLSDLVVALAFSNTKPPGDQVPVDILYLRLGAELDVLDSSSSEFSMVKTYYDNTSSISGDLVNVFKVNRHSEAVRYAAHDSLHNRQLLWYGTPIGSVVANIVNGIRIQPHSVGRLGTGIHFANEASRSAVYATPNSARLHVLMLCEVVLGVEHLVLRDDATLTAAPVRYFPLLICHQHSFFVPNLAGFTIK